MTDARPQQPPRHDAPDGTLAATITARATGARIDRILAEVAGAPSRSRIKSLIVDGHLSVDGATVSDPAIRVKEGQHVELVLPTAAAEKPESEARALDIVHEDADLIVVNKPADLVVHPAAGTPDGTLVNALIRHCGDTLIGTGPEHRGGVVHRLDKDTTGLLVIAKSEAAEAGLIEQFKAREIERRYIGLVWGCPNPTHGTLAGPIGRSPRHRKKMDVIAEGGRPAVTHYDVREALCNAAAAVVEFKLETGRTHQIRVHVTHAGHPLLGDPLYGGGGGRTRRRLSPDARTAAQSFPRQALHARTLGFQHPTQGDYMTFAAPLPQDMADLLTALGGDLAKHDPSGHI